MIKLSEIPNRIAPEAIRSDSRPSNWEDELRADMEHAQRIMQEEEEWLHREKLAKWVNDSKRWYYGPPWLMGLVLRQIRQGQLTTKDAIKKCFRENMKKPIFDVIKLPEVLIGSEGMKKESTK